MTTKPQALTAEEEATFRHLAQEIRETDISIPDEVRLGDLSVRLLATLDALRARLAAAEADLKKAGLVGRDCTDCGRAMVWDDPTANCPSGVCPHCVRERSYKALTRAIDAERERDAARAVVERLLVVMEDAASAPGIDWLHWQIQLGRTITSTREAATSAGGGKA